MKKDDNSGVSIKQIISTALFLVVTTLGGLNAYRIVCNNPTNTIQNIESANLEIYNYDIALVENTEEDIVHTENVKFLAVKTIEESGEILDSFEESKNENVVSRGNYLRENTDNRNETSIGKENEPNKLLNTVLNEIKEFNEMQEAIVENTIEDVSGEEKLEVLNETATLDTETVSDVENEPLIENKTLSAPTEYVKTIDVKATAYCLCKKCCGKSPSNPAYGITASGLKIVPGTGMKVVASDPTVIPLGTNVYIEGLYGAKDYGYAIVADTGSAIKNLKIDLYMDTHQMALNWGVKNVRVYILDK